jgi:ubiquinone/menaquinone biosynthesis C-methylase UbiE
MPPNQDQVDFWNGRMGHEWVVLQERMDANLSAIHDALMPFAAPQGGEAVLDIGCGTGTTSLALADAVGPSGRVTGLDVSREMLGLARQRGQGRANLTFVEADASQASFEPEYDLLFSRFGVMFFDDPAAGFANMRKAAKPGGRIAFACWRTSQENLWASAPMAAAKPFLPDAAPPDPLAPGPFAFADAARVRAILDQAGFKDARIEKFGGVMDMGRDLNLTAAQMLRIGPVARATADMDEAGKMKITAAVKDALSRFVRADGSIAPPVACWLVAARA